MSHIGKRSLNAQKGLTVNELELFFMLVDTLLEEKLSENPKSGKIMNKGTDNEVRMKYAKALKVNQKLYTQYAVKGCFSFGICGTCSEYNDSAYSSKTLGKCMANGGKEVSPYDTCNKHSISGGCHGLE